MDSSKFDDIIKNKIEDYVDLSEPSGAEMNRLFSELPATSGFAWSSVAKWFAASSTVLLITTIILIFRWYWLEQEMIEMRQQLLLSSAKGDNVWREQVLLDSIESRFYRVNSSRLTVNVSDTIDHNVKGEIQSTYSYSEQDLQLAVDRALEELIQTLQSNPEIVQQLVSNSVGSPQQNNYRSNQPIVSSRMQESETYSLQERKILYEALRSEFEAAEKNETEDLTRVNADSLSDSSSDDEQEFVEDGVASENVEKVEEDVGAMDLKDIRAEQQKQRNRSLSIFAGTGIGFGRSEVLGAVSSQPWSLGMEYKFSERLGLALSSDFNSFNGEVEAEEGSNLEIAGLAEASGLDIAEIKEFKINISWIDIPLEARIYVFPSKKIEPFALVSLRYRQVLDESYTVESWSGEYTPVNLEGPQQWSFPVYGYGLGAKFRINSRLKAAAQLQNMSGGQELSPYGDKLNQLQGQALIFYQLK